MASAPPCMCHFSGTVSLGRVQNETQNTKKYKKNGGHSSLYFHFFGAVSAGRVASAPGVSSAYSCFLSPLPESSLIRIRDLRSSRIYVLGLRDPGFRI